MLKKLHQSGKNEENDGEVISSIETGMESNGASFLRDEDSFNAQLVNMYLHLCLQCGWRFDYVDLA